MRCLSDDDVKLLSDGATAITQRPWLSSVIMRQFVERQSVEGQATWYRPRVLHLHAWLTSLWKQRRYAGATTPVLLTAPQETFLWHQIIEREGATYAGALLEVGATARQARSTALTCAEYEIPLEDPAWQQAHDPNQFAIWLRQLNDLCAREGWLTLAQLWRLMPGWLGEGRKLDQAQTLLFTGFDSITPALQRIVGALPAGAVTFADPLRAQSHVTKYRSDSPEQEWELAARWARNLVEENESASIGILVPDLDSCHERVRRVFDDIFEPGHLAAAVSGQSGSSNASPVHVGSAGRLSDHPLIAAALLVLEAVDERIPIASASALVRSPYLGGAAAERALRARADVQMRRSRELEVSLASLTGAMRGAPHAKRLFVDLQVFLKRRPESADVAYWARFIADLLKVAGWPGDSDLSVAEQALVEEWKDALSTVSSLGIVSTTVTWRKALVQLRRLLTVQQPHRGDAMSPVQLLDVRDAPGIQFDHVWVIGLSPEQWHSRFETFPLIPRALQMHAKIPYVTLAGQRQRERKTLDAMIHAGREVVASYVNDPLPMLSSYGQATALDPALHADAFWQGALWHRAFRPCSEMDQLLDSEAPHARNAKPAGGARILKSQSECPFRAFAEIRLNAIKPVEGTFGFDAMERGQFMHRVLEFVWKRIGTQGRLKALPEDELKLLVGEGIAAATNTTIEESEFHRELTEVERLRLATLVLDWLDVEKQRLMPFTVEVTEQGTAFEIEGVTIKLRIDRIDRLENGKRLLIDYKSGKQKCEKLQGERPDEPQLLVYAAAMGDTVEGVLFGQVMRGDLKLVGITKDPQYSSQKTNALGMGWARQQREWNDTVRRLAQGFRQGEAAVDPKTRACDFCETKPLCRIQEIRAEGAGDDEEGDE